MANFSKLETKLIVRNLLESLPFAKFKPLNYAGAYLDSNKKTFYVSFGNCSIDAANIITIFINKAPHEFYFTSEHSNAETAHYEAINIFRKIIDFYFNYLKSNQE